MKSVEEFSFSGIINEIKKLLSPDGEYLSHSTALYILGQISAFPHAITIVSPRRRRNRLIHGVPLVFVLHPTQRMKPTQNISFGRETLCVSTLEKTLIDLLADLDHAPPLKNLCQLFATLPFDTGILLNFAKITSDSVLKRVSFLLAWSGRASFKEIPFPSFSRTPVQLDTREKEEALVWDNRFYLKYPDYLLSIGPEISELLITPEIADWKELKSFHKFQEASNREKFMIIRGDQTFKTRNWLDSFFEDLFRHLSTEDLEELLGGLSSTSQPPGKKHRFPRILSHWVEEHPQNLTTRENVVGKWTNSHLFSQNPDYLESALFLGYFMGFHDKVISSLSKNGYKLFNFGRFKQINFLCEEYLKQKREIPSTIFVLAARSLARMGKYDQAISVLDEGKARFEQKENSELDSGELAYAMGNILRMMNKYHESLAQLYLARECFLAIEDRRGLGLSDLSLGNLFFTRGRIREARNYYLNSLSIMKSIRQQDSQASILGNLGLIEFDSGRLRKANLYLTRAMGLHRMLKNQWNESTIGISRAKILLTMGQFTQAIRVLKECHATKVQHKHFAGMHECEALLGWTSEMMGRNSASKAWWDHLPPTGELEGNPRVLYVISALRAMTALFRGELNEALELYASLLSLAETRDSSNPAIGDALHGKGFCQTLLKNPEASKTLKKSYETLAGNPFRTQLRQLLIFSALHFPLEFSEVSISEQANFYMESQAFDPFWGFYAPKLMNTGIPEAKGFLEYHLRKTPPGMLNHQIKVIPGFKEILKRIEIGRQRAAEFLTFIAEGSHRPIHVEDYKTWRKTEKARNILFDGPAGIISFASNMAFVKPKSIPHGILIQLFSAFPHAIDVEVLYKTVWSTVFDPECDLGAMKSAIQRLQRLLKSVNPAMRIRRRKTRSPFGGLEISISCRWEAVI